MSLGRIATIDKQALQAFYKELSSRKGFFQRLKVTKALTLDNFKEFIKSLPANRKLNARELNCLAYCLFDIETYENFSHKNTHELTKNQKSVRDCTDQLFGAELSAALRRLFNTTHCGSKTSYLFDLKHTVRLKRLPNKMLGTQRGPAFDDTVFDTLIRLPNDKIKPLMTLLVSYRYFSRKICELIPDQFETDYLHYLTKQIENNAFPDIDEVDEAYKAHFANIVYGYYWLAKGGIETPANRAKLLEHAVYAGRLMALNPQDQAEIQLKYQTIFDKTLGLEQDAVVARANSNQVASIGLFAVAQKPQVSVVPTIELNPRLEK